MEDILEVAGWSDWLSKSWGQIPSTSYTVCYFQFIKSWYPSNLHHDSLHSHVGLIFIFYKTLFQIVPILKEALGCLFCQCTSLLLQCPQKMDIGTCAICWGHPSVLVCVSELLRVCLVLKFLPVSYRFPICLNFSEISFTYGGYKGPRGASSELGRQIDNRLSETLGKTNEQTDTSQATNFIIQDLSFSAYGGKPS